MPELFAERWALTLAFPAISFIHFKLIFIPADKVKLINQCPGFELDPVAFKFVTAANAKTVRDCVLTCWPISGFLFWTLYINTALVSESGGRCVWLATMLIKLLQHSMCVFTCLLRSHPSPHPPCVFIVARPFLPIFHAHNSRQDFKPSAHIVDVFKIIFFFKKRILDLTVSLNKMASWVL